MRALRRKAGRSLSWVAEKTGLSYSYLSRLENNSATPGPETVTSIATALDGDLKELLELARCLPEAITDRIVTADHEAQVLRRAGFEVEEGPPTDRSGLRVIDFVAQANLERGDAPEIADALRMLCHLTEDERRAAISVIRTFFYSARRANEGRR